MRRTAIAIAAALAGAGGGAASTWAATPLSVRDSWRIGNAGTSFCSAQSLTDRQGARPACSTPAIRSPAATPRFRSASSTSSMISPGPRPASPPTATTAPICAAAQRGSVPGLGAGRRDRLQAQGRRRRLSRLCSCARAGSVTLPRASPATTARSSSAFSSLVADQPVKGEISIATTGVGDPAAFARVQAGTLRPDKALEEAYRRNNAGSYAEAAEFFAAASSGSAMRRSAAPKRWSTRRCKSPTSAASPKPNSLFSRAAEAVGIGPDRRAPAAQLSRHPRPQPGRPQGRAGRARQAAAQRRARQRADGTGKLEIDSGMAKRLNADSKLGQQLGSQSDELLPAEKAEILDGQALQLRGTSLRLTGDRAGAREALRRADARAAARCAAARSRRSCGCARRSSAISAPLPRNPATTPRPTGSTARRSHLLRSQLSRLRGAAELEGAARRLSRAQRPAGDRGSDVQRHRPFAARHQQPAAELRQCASALCRPAAEEGRRSQGRRPRFSPRPS